MKLKRFLTKFGRLNFAALIFSILLWIVFFPQFYANVDEHNYYRSSWKLNQGISLLEEESTQALGGFANLSQQYVSKYNLGNSIWLAPVSGFGIQTTMLISLLTYILLILTCAAILRELKISKHWLVLIILSPIFIYYSRTILSELPAALLFSLSYLSYLRLSKTRYQILLGISLGLLTLIRYNFAAWAILILLQIVFDNRSNLFTRGTASQLFKIALGALPFALLFIVINISLYGGITTSGYKFSGEEAFDFNLLATRLPVYIVILNLIYPLQFFVAFFTKAPLRLCLLVFSVFLLIFYSVAGGFLVQYQFTDFIVAIRFFVPVLPIIFILSAKYWQGFLVRYRLIKLKKILLGFAAIVLASSTILVNYYHQQFLSERFIIQQKLHQISTFEPEVFIGDEEDFMYLGEQFNSQTNDFDKDAYLNIRDFLRDKDTTILDRYSKIYLLELSYTSSNDRPTAFLKNSVAQLKKEDKLELVSETENFKIYEYLRN